MLRLFTPMGRAGPSTGGVTTFVPVRRDGLSTGGPSFRTTTQASQTSQSSPTHLLQHHDHHQVYKVWARGVEGFLQRLERSSMMEAPEEWKCNFFHSANKRCKRGEDCTFAHDQDHQTGWEAARKRRETKIGNVLSQRPSETSPINASKARES